MYLALPFPPPVAELLCRYQSEASSTVARSYLVYFSYLLHLILIGNCTSQAYNLCYSTLVAGEDKKKLTTDQYLTSPSGDVFVKSEVSLVEKATPN